MIDAAEKRKPAEIPDTERIQRWFDGLPEEAKRDLIRWPEHVLTVIRGARLRGDGDGRGV